MEYKNFFETNYVAVSIDGKMIKLSNDNYHSKFTLNYPYNQSELILLNIDYPNTVVKTQNIL